ncbi:hypothetical protein Y032_0204g1899 [Ancylostoma ceylanicum]|nr:hypothetical protein Y032_0204g1899 [Ancylostoma ceylanicum]
MISVRISIVLAAFTCCCLALECYTGFKYIKGRSVVDEKYEMLLAILNHCVSLYVPLVQVPTDRPNLPGYLVNLDIKRSSAWKKASITGNLQDWDYYKNINKVFEHKLWKFNKSIERKVIESRNKSTFYSFLSSRLKRKSGLGTLIDEMGQVLTSDRDKAEAFAKVFHEQCSGTAATNLDTVVPSSCLGNFPVMADSLWFHATEIYTLLSKWPSSRSVTPDGIPLSFIKEVAPIIAGPLAYIFNLSFMRAEVPSKWKVSYVTPIPKKAPYSSLSNYRPISITSIFARLFEKIVKKRLMDHLEKNAIISQYQHGFQKGKSTVTAVLQALNDWTTSYELNKSVDVVYLDFCKAFDKVPHTKLIYKLGVIGVHPRIIAWIQAFLEGRQFCVRVNSALSQPRPVRCGVPQGGVLSPILFIIYTFELPTLISNVGLCCCAFADDIKIYKQLSDVSDCSVIQRGIDAVAEWSRVWELPLSYHKTKVLRIGAHSPEFIYYLNGVAIEAVTHIRDLGFHITNKLDFEAHCDLIVWTSKMTCEHESDYCYNATADVTQLNEISMAGCSTTRCFLSRNKCITQIFQGRQIKFCCCNTGDLCNSKLTNLTLFEKTKQRVKDWFKIVG